LAVDGYIPESLTGPAADAFATARRTSHRTMFERADPLLTVAIKLAPSHPLSAAYLAHNRRMLYHDPAPLLDEVEALARSIDGAERALTDAIAAQARADWATALDRTEAFLGFHPEDPYARHKRGVYLLDGGRPAEAVDVLQKLLSDEPSFTPALNHLGGSYLALGRHEEAVVSLQRFVAAEPDNYSARDSLADALEATGDVRQAAAELQVAVELEPTFAYGWRHLGDVYRQLDDSPSAAQAYRRALDAAELYGRPFTDSVASLLDTVRAPGDG
jgi:tetratricopeptide (TPR) repeat protein